MRHLAVLSLLVVQAAGLAAGHGAAKSPGTPDRPRRWSDPSAWPGGRVPAAGADVDSPPGVHVALDTATPPLGMRFFADSETGSNYGSLTAAATIITAPLVIAFLVARRRFIEGITMTGIK